MDHQDGPLNKLSADAGSRARSAKRRFVSVATEGKDLHEDVQRNTGIHHCQLIYFGMSVTIARMLSEDDSKALLGEPN